MAHKTTEKRNPPDQAQDQVGPTWAETGEEALNLHVGEGLATRTQNLCDMAQALRRMVLAVSDVWTEYRKQGTEVWAELQSIVDVDLSSYQISRVELGVGNVVLTRGTKEPDMAENSDG